MNPPNYPITESDRLYRYNIFNENLNEIQESRREQEAMNFNPLWPLRSASSVKPQLHQQPNPVNTEISGGSAGLINDPLFRNQLQCFISQNQENLPILKDKRMGGKDLSDNNPNGYYANHLQQQFGQNQFKPSLLGRYIPPNTFNFQNHDHNQNQSGMNTSSIASYNNYLLATNHQQQMLKNQLMSKNKKKQIVASKMPNQLLNDLEVPPVSPYSSNHKSLTSMSTMSQMNFTSSARKDNFSAVDKLLSPFGNCSGSDSL